MKGLWKLIGYEWRKIWIQPVVWILLVLFTGYGVYSYSHIQVDPELKQVYSHITGPLTQETYETVTTTLQEVEAGERPVEEETVTIGGEELIRQRVEIPQWGGSYVVGYLEQAKYDMEGLMDFENDRVRIVEQAQRNMQKYQNREDRIYDYRYNELVYNQSSNRGDLILLEKTGWWNFTEFLGVMRPVNFFDLTALLLCMVALCSLFTKDDECGFTPVVRCSYLGRGTLLFAKMLSGFLFCVVTLAILRLGILITLAVNTDLSYVTAPVQSLSNFRSCPYNISILGMIVQQFFITVLFLLFFFLLGALAGILARRNYISLGVQFVVAVVLTALSLRPDASNYWNMITNKTSNMVLPQTDYSQMVGEDIMKIWNPGMVMRINEYYDHYDYVNVLGFPVSRLTLFVSWLILLNAILFLITWRLYTAQRSDHSLAKSGKKGRHHEKSVAHSV